MATMRDQEATRYLTENDSGKQITVVEWVTIIPWNPISGTSSVAKGGRRWTLLDGSGVNYVDENTFQVFKSKAILRKI